MMQSPSIITAVVVCITLIQHITCTPTPNPSLVSFPELSSPHYWPWNTRPLILPDIVSSHDIYIPDVSSPYYSKCQYVVWEISSNETHPYMWIRSGGNDVKYGIMMFLNNMTGAEQLYDSLSSSHNKLYILNGQLNHLTGPNIGKYHMLQICSDLVYQDYNIPYTRPYVPWRYYVPYFVTSRSYHGQYHMTDYADLDQAMKAYTALTNIFIQTNHSTIPFWETVAIYRWNKGLIQKISHSRGSELEHMGAFQWLEWNPNSITSGSGYYLMISYPALNGQILNRIHRFNTSSDARHVMQWNTWYNSIMSPLHPSSSYIYYYNVQTGRSTYVTSQTNDSNSHDDIALKQYYARLTGVNPTSGVTPYPTLSPTRAPTTYPTPRPYNPTRAPDSVSSYTWSDASDATQVFVVVLPIVVFTVVGMILLILTCCMTFRNPTTELETPRSVSCLACWILICSIMSFSAMMVSILIPRFSYMIVDQSDYIWASFGPFSMIQASPFVAWTNIHWTAKVFTKTVGISMILAMICLFMTVWRINKKHITKPFTVIIIVAAFLFTFAAIIMWIPIHMQIRDPNLQTPIVSKDSRSRSVSPHVGYSLILLTIAGIAQLLNVVCIIILRCSSLPSHRLLEHQAQQAGLQLVDRTSQYYYRDVPTTPASASAPTYVYGGVPTATPTYVPPVPAYVAPVYVPFEQSRPLSVGFPTATVPAPIASSYPTLTQSDRDLIPVNGADTHYHRLL